jgi:hypothetical protein
VSSSMRRVGSWCGIALSLALVSACESSSPPAPAPESKSPPPPLPAAAAPPAVADRDAVPTEEDFEDEATSQITSANLEAKLDQLEKEVGAE